MKQTEMKIKHVNVTKFYSWADARRPVPRQLLHSALRFWGNVDMRMETQNQQNIFFNIRGCFEISVFKISGVDCITDHFEIGINVFVFGNTLLR